MKWLLRASTILQNEYQLHPFVLGSFYSRSIFIDKYIITTVGFKKSEKVCKNFDLTKYQKKYHIILNNLIKNELFVSKNVLENSLSIQIPNCLCCLCVVNDISFSEEKWFDTLYSKILNTSWCQDRKYLSEYKKWFIRGFMENRGSIDTTRPLIAIDYFYNSKYDVDKAKILYDFMCVPLNVMNINFRELQKQYLDGKKRNTQFRLDLNWYVTNIGLINEYKVKIYKENYKNIGSERKINGVSFFTPVIQKHLRDTATFISYLNYFKEDIINQDLTSEQLNKIRKYLGFNYDSQKDRDIAMRDLFIELTPDICAICGIRETYERNRDRKQHFDVHHVISLNNNKQLLDVMDNLVKLCPTHHSMMKKSHGLYAHQLKSNLIILKNYKNVYSFAAAYFNEKNINLLAEKITKLLK